jgi:hypothetical protein
VLFDLQQTAVKYSTKSDRFPYCFCPVDGEPTRVTRFRSQKACDTLSIGLQYNYFRFHLRLQLIDFLAVEVECANARYVINVISLPDWLSPAADSTHCLSQIYREL